VHIHEVVNQTRKRDKYRKKSKVQCPAFDNEPVHINTHFWTHIRLQRNERPRADEEVLKRLRAIDKMIDIVESSKRYQDFYQGKDKNKILYYWTFIAVIDDIHYGVIVRRKGKSGNKHFYSIIPNYRGYIPRDQRAKVYLEK